MPVICAVERPVSRDIIRQAAVRQSWLSIGGRLDPLLSMSFFQITVITVRPKPLMTTNNPNSLNDIQTNLLFTMYLEQAQDKNPAQTFFLQRRVFREVKTGIVLVTLNSAPKWWSQTGSNRRPEACKATALPTELWPRITYNVFTRICMHHYGLVGLGRLELPTSRLSGVRSNHLSYRPQSIETVGYRRT